MLKIAVTGGIGAGKSVVCQVFKKLNIPVFNADLIAKEIINNNSEVKAALIKAFGSDIYLPEGIIHRKKLAEIIFYDKIALRKINSIVHPKVYETFQFWSEQQKSKFVIQEAAIVFENSHTDRFDKIITVTAPIDVKLKRTMQRDNVNKEKVLERMKNQLPDEYKIKHSDFVIINDDVSLILPQILNIYNRLI